VRRLTDQDRAREARRQGVLLDRLARQFEGRLAKEIASAMREMVEVWRLTQEVVPARGFRARLEAAYEQMIRASVVTFGTRIWEQAKAAGYELETKRFLGVQDFAQFMTLEAMRYLAREVVRQRIGGVDMETRQNILRAIARGFVEGEGQDDVAKRILDVIPSISRARAAVIARTETHGAANYGSMQAASATGILMDKEWLAAADERTRETHVEADGQIVPMDGAFRVGDALMEYPGDPAGPAEEVINCRCTLAYIPSATQ
jgi:SPP1 gp7 family putative phage head morphogenesis protein